MVIAELGVFAFIILGLIGLAILLTGIRFNRDRGLTQRIARFVSVTSERRLESYYQERKEFERLNPGNFVERALSPLFLGIISFLGRFTPARVVKTTEKKLIMAGRPFSFSARDYFGVRILLMIIGGIFTYLFYLRFLDTRLQWASYTLLLLFYLLPITWLNMLVSRRQTAIRNELPDILEILAVCTLAGLGFDQAIKMISEGSESPLGEEFNRVYSEIELGVVRQDALKNMVKRTDVLELSSFIAVIVQADKYGFSIVDTLQSQAEQIRILKQYRLKEKIQRLPALLMIPLAFLILPALFIVLLGPVVLQWNTLF